ncbi:hypothetical protein E2C01_015477 [Portunus trituberculatus]|uniref:Uncharacterized protein n=1 Tax=Portunus trituberculatus TaxID=210409 RepID=A0A5B7DLM8_PORTR|nr:hypothetical protein [Portunus trituberculatus]
MDKDRIEQHTQRREKRNVIHARQEKSVLVSESAAGVVWRCGEPDQGGKGESGDARERNRRKKKRKRRRTVVGKPLGPRVIQFVV